MSAEEPVYDALRLELERSSTLIATQKATIEELQRRLEAASNQSGEASGHHGVKGSVKESGKGSWTFRPFGERWEVVDGTSAFCMTFGGETEARAVADALNQHAAEIAQLKEQRDRLALDFIRKLCMLPDDRAITNKQGLMMLRPYGLRTVDGKVKEI